MRIVICINSAWNILNFRVGLIQALIAAGYEVVALAPYDKHVPQLTKMGCRFVEIPMDNGGTHPLRDAHLLWRFWKTLRTISPDVYLGYTVKPNIYGSLASHWLSIPVINNIAGLGSAFIKGGWLVHVVQALYRAALSRSAKVFFQNDDDRQLFLQSGLVRLEKTDLLPGSGIDLLRFQPAVMPRKFSGVRKFRFLMVARMLNDKGVMEFVEAAAMLREKWPHVEWCLLGFLDVKNPSAITHKQINDWVASGFVRYLGEREDVRHEIENADCVVLPSYREGIPRSLLEAAAMARPIITTDAVGCREVVDDGINGLICKVRDASDLASKMQAMLELPEISRIEMGLKGRKKMEEIYDERIVIKKYLEAINSVMNTNRKF